MANKKRRILVTGVARWWGALVVQRLVEDSDVAEVIGIDTREPPIRPRPGRLPEARRPPFAHWQARESGGHRHRRAHADTRRFIRPRPSARARDERDRNAQPAGR